MNQQSSTKTGRGLNPLIIVLLGLPVMVAILLAQSPWFALLSIGLCALAAVVRSPRSGFLICGIAAVSSVLVWVGLRLWLPMDAATMGALRIVALNMVFIVPILFVNSAVLADTLIGQCRAPYRVVDTLLLGGRFAVLMRQDFRLARGIATLRAAGNPLRRLRLHFGAIIAVLVASFRHSDQLTVAMESRGFGAQDSRTLRLNRPVTAVDVATLVLVWATTVVLAVIL